MINNRAEACRILEIDIWADNDEIKRAYKNLVKIFHPDAGLVTDTTRYNLIVEAYNFLIANPLVIVQTPPTQAPPQNNASGKILGGSGNYSYRRCSYDSFEKKYQQKKNEKAQKFEADMKAYEERMAKQDEEYKKAMDAINSIRLAEAIKAMIRNSK